jgi:hypothetical protein
MDVTKVGWGGGGEEWIQSAQDRDRWRALVNTVIYLGWTCKEPSIVRVSTRCSH